MNSGLKPKWAPSSQGKAHMHFSCPFFCRAFFLVHSSTGYRPSTVPALCVDLGADPMPWALMYVNILNICKHMCECIEHLEQCLAYCKCSVCHYCGCCRPPLFLPVTVKTKAFGCWDQQSPKIAAAFSFSLPRWVFASLSFFGLWGISLIFFTSSNMHLKRFKYSFQCFQVFLAGDLSGCQWMKSEFRIYIISNLFKHYS